jgi:lysozyme
MAGVTQAIHAVEEKADSRVEKIREAARRRIAKVRRDEKAKIERLLSAGDGKLSREGAEFIASWEGLRLTAYYDAVGVLTIGYGHTGFDVRPGMTITAARALELLEADAAVAARAVDQLVKVPINQHQEDALISFTFNCGVGALTTSTLLKVLNEGHHDQVPAQLMRWVNSPPLAGLVNRRRAECALWRKKP